MTVWTCGSLQLDLTQGPLIMGILNVTPDSFSDGYPSVDEAMNHAKRLLEDGADIIDVGGESTRPGSESVGVEVELDRVLPVIERLTQTCNVPLSIDTQKPEVARRAVEAGASIINHVSATLDHDEMIEVLQNNRAGYVAMHMKDRPAIMQDEPSYENLMEEMVDSLCRISSSLCHAGIDKDRLIFDPGIGFGKTLRHNLEILTSLKHLHRHLNRPILMGLSRKSWFTHLLQTPRDSLDELDAYTMLASTLLPYPEVAIHRVHNVRLLKQALLLKSHLSE